MDTTTTAPTELAAEVRCAVAINASVDAGAMIAIGPQAAIDAAMGEGLIAFDLAGGFVELRAARDGAVIAREGRLAISSLRERDGHVDAESGDMDVTGALRVFGQIAPGRHVRVTLGLEIQGRAEAARLEAGNGMILDRVSRSELREGSLNGVRLRLRSGLRGVPDDVHALTASIRDAIGIALRKGSMVTIADPLAHLVGGPFTALAEAIAVAHGQLMGTRSEWPNGLASLGAAVGLLHGAFATPQTGIPASGLDGLEAAARAIHAALGGPRPADGIGLRVKYLESSSAEATGAMRISGPGATDSEIIARSGLHCMASGSSIRGGHVTAAGRIRVLELGPSGNRRLTFVIEGRPAPGEVRFGLVRPGVDLIIDGRTINVEERRSDVQVDFPNGVAALVTAESGT